MAHQWDTRTITERLASISGVRGITADIERYRVTVVYDITQSNYHEMLAALEEIGHPAANNWWARSKANYFQYLDTNGRENANAPAAPCCSNPKKSLDGGNERLAERLRSTPTHRPYGREL
jgi:hypothetical protein